MTGVGEQNSLKLVLGSKLDGNPVKYRVFISEAGTTISKVFFDVDPAYPGEQTFFLCSGNRAHEKEQKGYNDKN